MILVTGGARRIGKAITLALAAKKANIAITCNTSEEKADYVTGQVIGIDGGSLLTR